MGLGAAIGAVGSIAGAAIGSKAAKKAGKAQVAAADKAAEVQRYMYDTSREDYAPYRAVGSSALYKLADLYGVSRPTTPAPATPGTGTGTGTGTGSVGQQFTWNSNTYTIPSAGGIAGLTTPQPTTPPGPTMTPGTDDWTKTPGYEFRRDESLRAIQRMGSAAGARFSPQTWRAGARYASNLASEEFGKYTNALRAMAGIGQDATGSTTQAGIAAGQGIANAYTNAGNARASSYGAQGAIWGNAMNNIGSIAGQFIGQNSFGGGSAPPLTPNVPYQFGGLLSGQMA